jgi:hypothetical protein
VEFLLSALFMIILLVFMLAKREELRNRFFLAVGDGRLAVMSRAIDTAAQRISRFLRMQLLVNVCIGLVWSVCLLLMPDGGGGLGVSYAFLWGAVLAVLRFVPYVGTFVALAFPLLLSVTFSPVGHPWLQPLLLVGVFLTLELVTFNVIEPLLFGRNTGVSPLALLIAAVFWAWLWGPIGLVLSTPLTVCLIVFGQYIPQLSLLHVLLGPEPPAETEASYYQRLLVRDEDEAMEIVQAHLAAGRPETVYDELLLPALSLARRDAAQGRLGPRDEQFIAEVTRRIVDGVVGQEQCPRTAPDSTASAGPVRLDTRLLGWPARGEPDELALHMLGRMLAADDCRMEIMSEDTLTSEVVQRAGEVQPAVACISALPPGGLSQASYLCKRLRQHFPDLKILVGRWGQTEDFEKAKRQLTDAGATKVVASLVEMLQEVLPVLALHKLERTPRSRKQPAASST